MAKKKTKTDAEDVRDKLLEGFVPPIKPSYPRSDRLRFWLDRVTDGTLVIEHDHGTLANMLSKKDEVDWHLMRNYVLPMLDCLHKTIGEFRKDARQSLGMPAHAPPDDADVIAAILSLYVSGWPLLLDLKEMSKMKQATLPPGELAKVAVRLERLFDAARASVRVAAARREMSGETDGAPKPSLSAIWSGATPDERVAFAAAHHEEMLEVLRQHHWHTQEEPDA